MGVAVARTGASSPRVQTSVPVSAALTGQPVRAVPDP